MKTKKDLRTDNDDERLLRTLRDNNKDALLVIFDRYSHHVYSYARTEISKRMAGAKADDAAQKILVMVFASLQANHRLIPIGTTLLDFLLASANRAITFYIQQEHIKNN